MRETATILEVIESDNTVLLQFHEQDSCKNCESVFCKANERTFTASNKKNFDLQVGNIVTVYVPAGKTMQASFLVLIAPLFLFFAFFIAAERIFTIQTEIIKIIFGIIGLVIGFLISYFMTKRNKKSSLPEIIEKKLP